MSSLGGTQKRRGNSSRAGGVKWDEANLKDNEIIKAAMQPLTKIREPKTPCDPFFTLYASTRT